MTKEIAYFYKIDAEVELGEDEEGNRSEAYLKLGFTLKKPVSEEKIEGEKMREKTNVLQVAANLLKVSPSLLTMITEAEFLAETEED